MFGIKLKVLVRGIQIKQFGHEILILCHVNTRIMIYLGQKTYIFLHMITIKPTLKPEFVKKLVSNKQINNKYVYPQFALLHCF